MTVKNYDPALVQMIFAGASIEGLADGTFLTAARNNQSFELSTGADGEGARAKSNDKSGTVVFTLLQTSASNDILAALALLDELQGDGVSPLMIKDLNGTTLVTAETAWVQKPADVERAKTISDTEWTIETNNLQIFPGGSASI